MANNHKGFFRRIWTGITLFIATVFTKAKGIAEKYIPVGIDVVEKIKLVMDSPVMPLLNALIPGTVDDVIAARVKQLLPDILLKLKIAGECSKKSTNDEIIQCAIKHLKEYHPDARKAYYLNIASMLSAALADGKLSWAEIVLLTQYTYEEKYAK